MDRGPPSPATPAVLSAIHGGTIHVRSASTKTTDRRWNITHGIRFEGNAGASPSSLDKCTQTDSVLPSTRWQKAASSMHSRTMSTESSSRLSETSDSDWSAGSAISISSGEISALEELTEEVDLLSIEDEVETPDEPAYTPCTFRVSDEAMEKAKQAKTGDGSFWDAELYRGPDGEKVKIHYCKTVDEAEKAAKLLLEEKVLGFDLEWKSVGAMSIKDKVSVIQLASQSDIVVIQVALFAGTTREALNIPSVQNIMENPDIMKTGVAINGDTTRLYRTLGVESQGIMELSRMYNMVVHGQGNRLCALAKQTVEMLGLPLRKDMATRCGDWTRPLNETQVAYAANDAYAAVHLFDVMERKRLVLGKARPSLSAVEVRAEMKNEEVKEVIENSTVQLPATPEPDSSDAESSAFETPPDQSRQERAWAAQFASAYCKAHRSKDVPTPNHFCLTLYALWHEKNWQVRHIQRAYSAPDVKKVLLAIMEVLRIGLPYEPARARQVVGLLGGEQAAWATHLETRYGSVRDEVLGSMGDAKLS